MQAHPNSHPQPGPIASREQWLVARKALLAREKEMSRLRDAINAERVAMPRVRIDKEYRFDTPDGAKSLAELFGGRSQLIVYHFMLPAHWEAGCTGCSFLADHFEATLPHLNHHDVGFVAVSLAPLDHIERYKRRMGWRFPWVSSAGSDFNRDFGVTFTAEDIAAGATYNYTQPAELGESPGLSAFEKGADGAVLHSYSTFARGLEEMVGTLMLIDRAPLGRNEASGMDWVRRHDEYADAPAAGCGAQAAPAAA